MSVLAISRQVGAMGEEIAALCAEKLGFQIIDQAAIHNLAECRDSAFKDACGLFESEIPKGFLDRFFFNDPAYTALFESLNFELAAQGNVIIMGRGAQIVLGNEPNVLKVRIVCPTRIRVERVAAERSMPVKAAMDYVHRYGHQRRTLIQSIYNKDLSDWALYDLIVNTAAMSAEAASEVMVAGVRGLTPIEDVEAHKEELRRKAFGKMVESVVKKEVVTTPFHNIEVQVPGPGRVQISGFSTDRFTPEKAEKAALSVPGVEEVDIQIRTTTLGI